MLDENSAGDIPSHGVCVLKPAPDENRARYRRDLSLVRREASGYIPGIRFVNPQWGNVPVMVDNEDRGGWGCDEFGIPSGARLVVEQGALPRLSALLGPYLQARYGRKVRLELGDFTAEASSTEEVEWLFKRGGGISGEAAQECC